MQLSQLPLRVVVGVALVAAAAVARPADAQLSRAVFAFTSSADVSTLTLASPGGPVSLTAIGRGWYTVTDVANGSFAGNNYIAGICGSGDVCSADDLDRHDWFRFGVPGGVTYTGATLSLTVPSPNGYISPNPTELYELFDVLTPIATLGTSGPGIFGDLGSGTIFGSYLASAADIGTTVSITLNAAGLAAINAAAGGDFAIGGAVLLTPGAVVPEPATVVLLASGLALVAGLGARRRRS